MISKYRNRALLQTIFAIILTISTVVFLVVLHKHIYRRDESNDWGVLIIPLFFADWAMWMLVSFTLAKAKGYSKDFAGGLFIMMFILGFCIPMAPMLFPLYIIFAMEDRAKDRTRRR
jgi:uncharacterized membrane protein